MKKPPMKTIDIDAIERENELLLAACRAAHAWLKLGLDRNLAARTLCPEGLTRAEQLVRERLQAKQVERNPNLVKFGG